MRKEFSITKKPIVIGSRHEETEVAPSAELRKFLTKFSPKVLDAFQIDQIMKLYAVQTTEQLDRSQAGYKMPAQLPVTIED